MDRLVARSREFFSRFLHSPEGHIFFFGLIFALVFLGGVLGARIFYDDGGKVVAMVVYHLAAGRLGGISKGLHDQADPFVVFLVSFALEMLVTLLLYPLAIYSTREAIRLASVKRPLDQIMSAAQRYRKPVMRWGVPGLLFFNWLPIYLTGPLISAIVARLIGFSNAGALVIATLGTVLSVTAWIWTVDPIIRISGRWSFVVPSLLLVIALVYALVHFLHRKRRRG